MAVCSKHIKNDNSKFICSDHSISFSDNVISKLSSIKKIPYIEVSELKYSVQSLLSEKVFYRKKREFDNVKETDPKKESSIQRDTESQNTDDKKK